MNVMPLRGDGLNGSGRELAVDAFGDEKLGTVGEELGSSTFVGLYVGSLTADDGVIRLAERGERQRVCRRTIEGKKDLALGLKQLPEGVRRGAQSKGRFRKKGHGRG